MIFPKGLNTKIIHQLCKIKNEPAWMKKIRKDSYNFFKTKKNPSWGPDLTKINFNDYIYYVNPLDSQEYKQKWSEVPKKIKDTFKKLNIIEAEAKYLSGVNNQYDSQTIYHKLEQELESKNVIFTNIETAIKKHPDLVKKYFNKVVDYKDNKYAALNTAVWSGGTFLYVPKNTKLDRPLQSYFRINTKSAGQFERTLIILEENAQAHYIEGCTAPIYDKNNLHAAVVEIYLHKNAKFRYTTIQNWSENVLNLVTKRALVKENAIMEWVDGNLGSNINMKYPACILSGENAIGKCISIAIAKKGMIQDTGAKMIHLAPKTRSQIISKSIATGGGISNFRGLVKITKNAKNSYSEVSCDTLLLDKISQSDTIPTEIISNNSSILKHEAKITNIDKEKMFYLNSRKIDEKTAKQLVVLGFIKIFSDELPMEYAVELNRLLKMYI